MEQVDLVTLMTCMALGRRWSHFVELSRNQAFRLLSCSANVSVIWEDIEDDSNDIIVIVEI